MLIQLRVRVEFGIKMKKSRIYAYPARVTMLDAITLDQEVFKILKFQLRSILAVIPPWLVSQHESQLDLILHYIIWKLSVSKFRGTFGQQLLNMKYSENDSNKKKLYTILLAQIVSYLNSNNFFVSSSDDVNDVVKRIDILVHLCSLMNLLWFFREGKYPTLMDRILCMRPVCIVNKPRSVGYNYMTRELLWHGFMELLTFTLSMINYQYIRRKFNRIFAKSIKKVNTNRVLKFTTDTTCSICSECPVLPQHMGCAHVFCYYCIQTNRLVDDSFECPDCGYYQKDVTSVHV